MENSQKRFCLKVADFKIALAVAICMLTYCFVPQLQVLSACTAALMCCMDSEKLTIKSGLTRVLTALIGGIIAVLIVYADSALNNEYLLVAMMFVGLVIAFIVFRACKVDPIPCRVGCVTVILVLCVNSPDKVEYAVNRVIATIFGAIVALVVCFVFNFVSKKIAARKSSK